MRQPRRLIQTIIFFTIFAIGGFGTVTLQAFAEVSVEASLSHLSFPLDKAARLTITITGTRQNAEINLPEIDNIRLHNRGTSSQISVVNGNISSSISHDYLVQALEPGSYTIPALQIRVEGKSYKTKSISFQVSPIGQKPNSSYSKAESKTGEIAFIRFSLPSGDHYSGEIVPLTIKAYFDQAYRADLNSLPVLNGDGVVMSQLQDQPQQTQETVNGRMYHVLIWDTSLSGIKVGEHPISFSLDATLLIPQRRQALSSFGGSSLFDDSTFDSFFGGHQRKPIVSVSPKIVFTVLPLPVDDRPSNFTGAIGDFDLKVTASPEEVEVGEPMTLTMEISGTGNFDRVEAPSFPESPDWKTYSPTSQFSAETKKFAGTKTFEQAIVAKSGEVPGIPPLSLSYFDPTQKRYITKTSETLNITVKTPATARAVPSAQVPPVSQHQQAPQMLPTPNIIGLAPLHLETGRYHENIVPLFKSKWFLTVCALCILVMLTLFVQKIRRQNIEKHPERELQKKRKLLLEQDLKQVDLARERGDTLSFLSHSRTAIQNQLGLLWDIEPTTLSLANIQARLSLDSIISTLFSTAEEAAYGGPPLTGGELQDYFVSLKKELENLL